MRRERRRQTASSIDRLLHLPTDADSGGTRIARLVAAVAGSGLLAVSIGAALVGLTEADPGWATNLTLGLMIALCLLTLLTVRLGHHTAAARLLFLTGAAGTTALVLTGRTSGFADVGMMLYPVLAVMATLFFGRLEAMLAQGLLLLLLVGVLAAAVLAPADAPPVPELLADFGFATLIVIVSAFASRLMAADMERSEERALANQMALARAHRELQARAAHREELVDELAARNEELQRFTRTVSHELKSPLVTIGAFVGCIERDLMSDDHQRLLIDLGWIRRAQQKMNTLLASLLELSRIGRVRSPSETLSFAEIVAEAGAACETILAERQARLEIAGELPLVFGDRARLIQAVRHLIENAVRFSGDSPAPLVEVGARQLDGEIVLYVRDEGIGIEPRYQPIVFELFRQLQPDTPGCGIGLALAQRIVEVHGGRLWVESEGAGKGSEFRFTLACTQTDLG